MNPFDRKRAALFTRPEPERRPPGKNGQVPTSVYLNPAQKAKFKTLGGSKWLQTYLDGVPDA